MELTSLSSAQSASPRPSKSNYASASNNVASKTSLVVLPEPGEQHTGGRPETTIEQSDQHAEALDEEAYPTKPKLVILTFALMTAVYMIGLDTYIIGG